MPTIRPILAIDLGSYCTRAIRVGRSDSLEELSVLGLSSREAGPQKVMAVGAESLVAKAADRSIELVWPVDGAIHDYISCEAMLRYFARRLIHSTQLLRPLVLVSVGSGLSDVDRRAAYDTVLAATSGHGVYLVEDALAVGAAAGKVMSDRQWLTLQMGAGAASMSVFEQGGTPYTRRLRFAGNHFDLLIRRQIWDELGLRVDLETCRALKHAIGTVGGASTARLSGSNVLNDEAGDKLDPEGLAPIVRAAVEAGLTQLVDELQWFVRELPDNVQRELGRTHIIAAGGSVKLPGIAEWLSDHLQREIDVMDEPDQAVIRSLEIIATDFEAKGWFRKLQLNGDKSDRGRRYRSARAGS